MTTQVSFVRHGEVQNPWDVYYGRLPGFGLSAEGERQAQGAACYLAQRVTSGRVPAPSCPKTPVAICTSPMRRAHQTAQILASRLPGLSPQISLEISEVYTPFDGQSRAAMLAREWDFYTDTEPPYEQPNDIVARARRFIGWARARHAGEHVVAVTHGDVVTFMLLWAMGESVAHASKGKLAQLGIEEGYPAPASISSLLFETGDEGERPEIVYVRPYDP